MLTYEPEVFESDIFALQIIAKGAFIDAGTGRPSKAYAVEAVTVRLNWVALNEWISSNTHNSRECYEDGSAGDEEWEAHKAEYEKKRKEFGDKVIRDLGLDGEKGSVAIGQAQSEVFTVVYTWEIADGKARTE